MTKKDKTKNYALEKDEMRESNYFYIFQKRTSLKFLHLSKNKKIQFMTKILLKPFKTTKKDALEKDEKGRNKKGFVSHMVHFLPDNFH